MMKCFGNIKDCIYVPPRPVKEPQYLKMKHGWIKVSSFVFFRYASPAPDGYLLKREPVKVPMKSPIWKIGIIIEQSNCLRTVRWKLIGYRPGTCLPVGRQVFAHPQPLKGRATAPGWSGQLWERINHTLKGVAIYKKSSVGLFEFHKIINETKSIKKNIHSLSSPIGQTVGGRRIDGRGYGNEYVKSIQ